MKKYLVVFALAVSAFSTSVARANDGGIAWGGSPKLLSSHPSVAMQSEVIRMTVTKDVVTVDCRFVFRNYGRATTVRMGFPDEGSGDTPHFSNMETDNPKTPATGFTSFKSWVDGKPVKTKLIRSNEAQKSWHAKAVRFPANSTRIVRDLYTVPVGGQFGSGAFYSQASYTLHTGASWRGPIGRSEIIVNFVNTGGAANLKPVSIRSLKLKEDEFANWRKLARGTVLYSGPSAPTANGRTLRWVRTNWNPTEKDDIYLAFNPKLYPVSN